jgi:hypothetical protein
VDKFAVGIVAGVEVGTVAVTFIGILIDDGSKMFLIAVGVALRFLAPIPRAVIAVIQIFLGSELLNLNLFFIARKIL